MGIYTNNRKIDNNNTHSSPIKAFFKLCCGLYCGWIIVLQIGLVLLRHTILSHSTFLGRGFDCLSQVWVLICARARAVQASFNFFLDFC